MKVALITDGIFPYVIGGMQKHSYYLAKYFAQRKIDVDLYHTNQSSYDINQLELFTEDEKRHIHSLVIDFPKYYYFPGHYLVESYVYSKRVFNEFIKRKDVDFIYVKGFSGWKLIAEKSNGLECAPVGINFHGYEMFQPSPSFQSVIPNSLLRRAVLLNVKKSDYVFSYGSKITDIIRSINIPSSKIMEIPTGIEPAWLNENSKANKKHLVKFIFIGRYERRKGVELLYDILKEMDDTAFTYEFHFVGPIPEQYQLKSNKVFYHGSISDHQQMKAIIKECDVLVCPSFSEGMPNVIMEAMASGLAVIATNVGAVDQLVNTANGWLIEPGDKNKLKKTLIDAMEITDKNLSDKKQVSVKRIREIFLWDHIADKTISKITECLKK